MCKQAQITWDHDDIKSLTARQNQDWWGLDLAAAAPTHRWLWAAGQKQVNLWLTVTLMSSVSWVTTNPPGLISRNVLQPRSPDWWERTKINPKPQASSTLSKREHQRRLGPQENDKNSHYKWSPFQRATPRAGECEKCLWDRFCGKGQLESSDALFNSSDLMQTSCK